MDILNIDEVNGLAKMLRQLWMRTTDIFCISAAEIWHDNKTNFCIKPCLCNRCPLYIYISLRLGGKQLRI